MLQTISNRIAACALAATLLAGVPDARAAEAASYEDTLKGATEIGSGPFTAYRKGKAWLLAIPKDAFGKAMIWYARGGRPAGRAGARTGNRQHGGAA